MIVTVFDAVDQRSTNLANDWRIFKLVAAGATD